MDAPVGGSALLFAGWRFDPIVQALSRRDSGEWHSVPLGSRALGILTLLLEQPGAVVSKDRIMRAVWPATIVEPNNLTVQIATLRRVLDKGQEGESLIQTVPGQGYRLACSVEAEASVPAAPDPPLSFSPARGWRGRLVGASRQTRTPIACMLLLAAIAAISAALRGRIGTVPTPPPISVVAISFEDAPAEATPSPLARDLTDNVAADLARMHLFGVPHNVVIASPSAVKDAVARYALRGSLHQLGGATSLDVQLVEAKTGAELWAQRVDFGPGDMAAAQAKAVRRIVSGAGPAILTAEVHRWQQERPDQPSALDLMLQARLLLQLPPSPQRVISARDLFERAVQLDPSSVILKGQLADFLMEGEDLRPSGFKSVLIRTEALVDEVRTAIPNSQMALRVYAHWLFWQDERCPEAIEVTHELVDMYPSVTLGYRWLGRCLTFMGRAEEALPWLERGIRVAGVSDPYQFSNFRSMGDALLDLGRFKEAIDWYQRGLASNPDDLIEGQSRRLNRIAIAQALDGNITDARQTMARAQAVWPFWTVRSETHFDTGNPASEARIRHLQEGLRLAGMRDHADEAADFGVAPIDTLRQATAGYTSLTVPGATTLRTADIARLVAGGTVIIIDAVSQNAGSSLPGAIRLRYVGAGGSLSDLAQDHLRRTMQELTKGDLDAPILAVGWNSERFDGTNLVLRLVALGYRHVFWYRGGREAWEANGEPETPLNVRNW